MEILLIPATQRSRSSPDACGSIKELKERVEGKRTVYDGEEVTMYILLHKDILRKYYTSFFEEMNTEVKGDTMGRQDNGDRKKPETENIFRDSALDVNLVVQPRLIEVQDNSNSRKRHPNQRPRPHHVPSQYDKNSPHHGFGTGIGGIQREDISNLYSPHTYMQTAKTGTSIRLNFVRGEDFRFPNGDMMLSVAAKVMDSNVAKCSFLGSDNISMVSSSSTQRPLASHANVKDASSGDASAKAITNDSTRSNAKKTSTGVLLVPIAHLTVEVSLDSSRRNSHTIHSAKGLAIVPDIIRRPQEMKESLMDLVNEEREFYRQQQQLRDKTPRRDNESSQTGSTRNQNSTNGISYGNNSERKEVITLIAEADVRVIAPVAANAQLIDHGTGTFIKIKTVNVHKTEDVTVRDMDFYCHRIIEEEDERNTCLTTLSRFFDIVFKDAKCLPTTLKPFEEHSFLVQIERLPENSSDETQQKSNETKLQDETAVTSNVGKRPSFSSILCSLNFQCGNNSHILQSTVNVGRYPKEEDIAGGHRLVLKLDVSKEISLMKAFSVVATVQNDGPNDVDVCLVTTHEGDSVNDTSHSSRNGEEKKTGSVLCQNDRIRSEGSRLVCQQGRKYLGLISPGCSRTATLFFLPIDLGFHDIPIHITDKTGRVFNPKEISKIFVSGGSS